jgi:hypothetical protein
VRAGVAEVGEERVHEHAHTDLAGQGVFDAVRSCGERERFSVSDSDAACSCSSAQCAQSGGAVCRASGGRLPVSTHSLSMRVPPQNCELYRSSESE